MRQLALEAVGSDLLNTRRFFRLFINVEMTSCAAICDKGYETEARDMISLLTFGLLDSRKRKVIAKSDYQMPTRITLAFQFERASQVVETALVRSESIQSLHRDTVQQLDATEYALHRLFDEIHSVLPSFAKPVYDNAVVRTGEAAAVQPVALAA